MKSKIAVILTMVIVLSCFSGCVVKKTGPSATGESSYEVTPEVTNEITSEETKELSDEKISLELPVTEKYSIPESTEEFTGPSDNYPIEYLDFDFKDYPQRKGFLEVENMKQIVLFETQRSKKSLEQGIEGFHKNNNFVLAKIEKVEKLKINDRYFLKYKYNIQKVYYGNLKKNDIIDVYVKDWTIPQELCLINEKVSYDQSFKTASSYPRPGQYIMTRIHTFDFDENLYPNSKAEYINYYNNVLYKNELKLMKENYFIESNIYEQLLFDKNKNIISTGAGTLEGFRSYKNDDKAEIEKISDVDEFIEYYYNN